MELSTVQNQVISTFYKSIIGFIPGAHVIDEIVEFKAKIQQERLSAFNQYLKEGFEKVTGKSFNPENLKSEEFLDTFEIIVRKVAQTKSKQKILRYKNVLLRSMFEKDDSEMFSKYIALIDEIGETQILILSSLATNGNLGESEIMRYLANPDNMHEYLLNLLEKNEFTLFNGQTISTAEVNFFVYDLKSKGVISLVPETPRQMQHGDTIGPPKEIYKLSPIGIGFLNFIRDYGH